MCGIGSVNKLQLNFFDVVVEIVTRQITNKQHAYNIQISTEFNVINASFYNFFIISCHSYRYSIPFITNAYIFQTLLNIFRKFSIK